MIDWEKIRDAAGEPERLKERQKLRNALDEATRLIDEEHYTTDDCHTGIIYKSGNVESIRRVSVEIYMMMQALIRGVGMGAEWQRKRKG